MRKFLPSEQYRLLKNRKSARLCRRKRKEERGDMQSEVETLRKENISLKAKLEETQRQLGESQRALELQQQMFENQMLTGQGPLHNSVGGRLMDS